MRRLLATAVACIALLAAGAPAARRTPLPVEELRLDNGLRLLLLPRPEAAMVVAGWVARVGSADDPAGQSGTAHLIEHLLFQGTTTVGARDPGREAELLAEEDRLVARLAEGVRPKRRGALEERLAAVRREARSTTLPGELSLLYSEVGGVDLNAHTLRDSTLYYVTLPGEQLERWFWLESDRLLDPVFREFYKERSVVAEERRRRIDAAPGGPQDARLRALFWGDHPYAWPPIGLDGELAAVQRPAAEAFFRRHYRPERVTAALVGGFDPAEARRLARRYFDRLPAGAGAVPAGGVAPRHRPGRLDETCRCPEQVRLLYPTVPFGHADEAPLELLAELLGGRSGRLHRSLVDAQGLAVAATAGSHPLRQAGYFSVSLEPGAGVAPERLLTAWQGELERLVAEPVADDELRRLRSRLAADHLRRLREPRDLLHQLLVYDALGGWRRLDELPREWLTVEAGSVQRVARRYLAGGEPTVGILRDAARRGAP